MAEINSVNHMNEDSRKIHDDADPGVRSAEGGLSDDDTDAEEARGSDTPGQNLEIDGDTTESSGTRKRRSIEDEIDESDIDQNRHVA